MNKAKLFYGLTLGVFFLICFSAFFNIVSASGIAEFTTYNDLGGSVSYSSTGNVTNYSFVNTAGGNLIKYSDGTNTGISISFANAGAVSASQGAELSNPSPTWYTTAGKDVFNEFINVGGATTTVNIGYASQNTLSNITTITLTGVSASKNYDIVIMGDRGNAAYTDRYTKYTLSGMTSGFVNSSSAGTTKATTTLAGDTTYYLTGNNYTNGYVAKWTNVTPTGNTLTLAVRGVNSSGNASSTTGYANAIKIIQYGASATNVPILTASSAESITTTGAVLNGDITNDGGGINGTRGFEYGTTTSYGFVASTTGSYSTGSYSQSVTGLVCGTTYHYRAFSINSYGTGTSTDQTFITSACSVPDAPTSVTATAGNHQANVSFSVPVNNGGSSIISYTVTSNPGTKTCTTVSTSCIVTGLTNGTPYTFTVTATNAIGTGSSSLASASVTPNPNVFSSPVLVQEKGYQETWVAAGSASDTGISTSLDSPTTAGHLLITTVALDKSAGIFTIPSGFTLIKSFSGVSTAGAMAYKIADGTETSVSWGWTVYNTGAMWVGEYSGMANSDVLDISAEAGGTETSLKTLTIGPTSDTTQADTLVVAMIAGDSYQNFDATETWSNDFVEEYEDTFGNNGGTAYLNVATKIATTTGPQTTTFTTTGTGDQVYGVIAAFKVGLEANNATTTISSSQNKVFTLGASVTSSSPITIVNGESFSITASNDIRIKIPSDLNMTWDTTDTNATISGGASSKVSNTVTYENSGKTLVIDVLNDLDVLDSITISGLSFTNFSDISNSKYLGLIVDGQGGLVVVDDTKTISIIDNSQPLLQNVSFVPSSYIEGSYGDLIVNFTTVNSIPSNGKISVTLPPGFTFNAHGKTIITSASISGALTLSTFSTSTIVVTRSGGSLASGALSLTISNVRNPIDSGITGSFSIRTMDNSSNVIDEKTNVSGLSITEKNVGNLQSASITLSNPAIGGTGNMTFSFDPTNLIPSDGKIMLKLPSGFTLNSGTSSSVVSVNGLDGDFTINTSGNDTIIISRPEAIKHVIVVSMDGLGAGYLQTQINAGLAPNFKLIQDTGTYTNNARTDDDVAVTSPSHTGILTGRAMYGFGGSSDQTYGHSWSYNGWPDGSNNTIADKHGSYVPSVFDVIHDNGLRTGLYVTKDKLATIDGGAEFGLSWNETNGNSDYVGEDNGKKKIDSVYEVNYNSTDVLNKFKQDMLNNPFNYTLVHFSDTDTVGHASNWGSANYQAAITAEDGYLGEIINLVEDNASLKDKTVIIVTTDHGGHSNTHGDTSNSLDYTIPFYVWGPDHTVSSGVELYSLNQTTRVDPLTGHVNYSNPENQPIRNSDSANLALKLLGLPAIVTSMINSDQSLTVASTSPISITVSNIKNPTIEGVTNTFEIQTQENLGRIIDKNNSISGVQISDIDTVPDAPTSIIAYSSNQKAIVTFDAPINDGGSNITGYTVVSIPAGGIDSHAGTMATSHTITGLTNGTSYTFQVVANNAIGTSSPSSASNSIIPAVDNNRPVISNIQNSSNNNNSRIISWTTDEPSTSFVRYGLLPSLEVSTTEINISNMLIDHTVNISNLIPCATYYYSAGSRDLSDNISTGATSTFTTSGCVGNAQVLDQFYERIIHTSGGMMTFNSVKGPVVLDIPDGATTDNVVYQMKLLDRTPFFVTAGLPVGKKNIGEAVLDLKALSNVGESVSQFSKPLKITLEYNKSDLGSEDESLLMIYRYDDGVWTALSNCLVDTNSSTVTCDTEHFSVFGIFANNNQLSSPVGSSSNSSYSSSIIYGCKDVSAVNYNFFSSHKQSLCLYDVKKDDLKNASLKEYVFTKTFGLGSVGLEIRHLQKFLNSNGYLISQSGPGSKGNETNKFGPATKKALMAFQKKNKILPATGYFGIKTKAFVNKSINK